MLFMSPDLVEGSFNHCPAESGVILLEDIVDPDQLSSGDPDQDSHSFHSDRKHMLIP